jgi:hypothetical protein
MSKKILNFIPEKEGGNLKPAPAPVKKPYIPVVEEFVPEVYEETHIIKSDEDLDGDGVAGDELTYVTAAEYAKANEMKTPEVYKLIRSGEIKAVKQKGRWMIIL